MGRPTFFDRNSIEWTTGNWILQKRKLFKKNDSQNLKYKIQVALVIQGFFSHGLLVFWRSPHSTHVTQLGLSGEKLGEQHVYNPPYVIHWFVIISFDYRQLGNCVQNMLSVDISLSYPHILPFLMAIWTIRCLSGPLFCFVIHRIFWERNYREKWGPPVNQMSNFSFSILIVFLNLEKYQISYISFQETILNQTFGIIGTQLINLNLDSLVLASLIQYQRLTQF